VVVKKTRYSLIANQRHSLAACLPRPLCIIDKGGEVATRPEALDLDGPSL